LKKEGYAALHLTYTRREVVLFPAEFSTMRETVYVPGVVNVCVGFLMLEVSPSQKSYSQEFGALKDMSVKKTVNGATPMLLLIAKKETGAMPGLSGTRGDCVPVGVGVTVRDSVTCL